MAEGTLGTISNPDAQIILKPGESVNLKPMVSTLSIKIEQPPKQLFDPSLYAPAIPGVLVALAGLGIAHWLTILRDRRKEIRDLCTEVKRLANEASVAALNAWMVEVGSERAKAIHETKRKLQEVGIAATYLQGRLPNADFAFELTQLRRAATADPFEEPARNPSEEAAGAIQASLARLLHAVEQAFGAKYH